jgi:hypothetical protein
MWKKNEKKNLMIITSKKKRKCIKEEINCKPPEQEYMYIYVFICEKKNYFSTHH